MSRLCVLPASRRFSCGSGCFLGGQGNRGPIGDLSLSGVPPGRARGHLRRSSIGRVHHLAPPLPELVKATGLPLWRRCGRSPTRSAGDARLEDTRHKT